MTRPLDDQLITLPVEPGVERALEEALRGFCARAGVGPTLQRRLRLVLEELVTNTLSYGQCVGSTLEIGLRLWPTALAVDYRDQGIPFDPATQAPDDHVDEALEDRPVGGLGWTLIRGLCNGLSYRREAGTNCIAFEMPLAE